jgi:regulator of sigma E protease
MAVIQTVLAFLFALGVIVFVHEAGHLLMAKAFNIRVLGFSLGFGKRIWGFTRGETEYKVSLLPLGGYVKLGGEQADELSDDPRDFLNRPRWQRILVYLAGPAMNFLLAWILIAIVFMVGIDAQPRKLPPVIGEVLPKSPAAAAGLLAGDRILAIDGEVIADFQQAQIKILAAPEKPLAVEIERAGSKQTLTVTPLRIPDYDLGEAGLLSPGKVRVQTVVANDPAAQAGLKPGDLVVAAGGRSVTTREQLIQIIEQHGGRALELAVERGKERLSLAVTPKGEANAGKIGVSLDFGFYQQYSLGAAFVESYHYNLDFVKQTFAVLGKIFGGEIKAKSALAGPIEMAVMSGQQAERGFRHLLHLMAFISVSIALFNLFPVPILDGGQIAILLVESVIRRDLPLVFKERLAQVGGVLLLALFALVMFFDLQKRF